jgi:elongation factor P hydroxylase
VGAVLIGVAEVGSPEIGLSEAAGGALGSMSPRHGCDALIALFNRLFKDRCHTELVRGGDEPIYLPADADHPRHRIIFAHGYFASALHEISHWCIAGSKRRLLEDFGYWYRPDGRSAEQQAEFEWVEVKPQALEWMLARACGFQFRISCDNLSGEFSDMTVFKDRVYQQVLNYLERGLAERPCLLIAELCRFYHQPALSAASFGRADLDW